MSNVEEFATGPVKPDMKDYTYEVSKASSGKNGVVISIRIQGTGNHQFSVRTSNLTVINPVKQINLKPGKAVILKWYGKIETADESWVAVIVPDNDLTNRKELTGSLWK
jgi:hypothetical protein